VGRVSAITQAGAPPAELLQAACGGDGRAFQALIAPHLRALHLHSYRMLGSYTEADDAVQETLLRAWQGLAGFEGRAPLLHWLYRITTTTCLKMIRDRRRQPATMADVAWLQPYPDTLLDQIATADADPACLAEQRESVALAFIAALQLLPARQRAVLTLRDVLAFRTGEVAEMLDMTVAAVDSALRRARGRLAAAGPVQDELAEPDDEARRGLLDGYVEAFVRADADALVGLLRADVELEMPPIPTWFAGRDAVVGFLAGRVLPGRRWRLVPTRANGQPAFVVYERVGAGRFEPYGVQVLTVLGVRIARITAFNDPGLVPVFERGSAAAATARR
jgi:RNA polymerase sigma-70 factor, ECF subfamily